MVVSVFAVGKVELDAFFRLPVLREHPAEQGQHPGQHPGQSAYICTFMLLKYFFLSFKFNNLNRLFLNLIIKLYTHKTI